MTAQRFLTAGLWCLAAVCLDRRGLAALEVTPAKIELIPPGTVVGDQAPAPWTHLIIKSQPRVTDGDVDSVSRAQIRLAGEFFFATLARVERVEAGGAVSYRLARLASGVGANVHGKDTIISPDTADRLGADVGLLGGIVLSEMYDQERSVAIVLRSDTIAVYDTPIVIRLGDRNRSLVLRYGVVLDRHSGRLDTLAWLIDVDDAGRYRTLTGNMQWLAANKVLDCHLYVDKSEYTLGIPSDNAFACLAIPPGRIQIAVKDPPLATLLARQRWTASEAPTVDASLRNILQRAQAAFDAESKR